MKRRNEEMKKYYIKAMQQVTFGVYKTVVLKTCNDLDQAFDMAFELSSETGMNCFVDFEF